MEKPSYPFKKVKKELLFEFDSVSDTKIVHKVIAYELIDYEKYIFNLSLVDRDENGKSSDLVVSDNQDMEKVLATVVQTLPLFFDEFKAAKVFFKGSTDVRTRLYRIIIAKFYDEFKRDYDIFGFEEGNPYPFETNRNYEAFLITKKQTDGTEKKKRNNW